MITETSLYWITRLDYIHNLASLGVVLGLLIVGLGIYSSVDKEFAEYICNVGGRMRKIGGILLGISLIIVLFLPTKKEMCAIKVIPAIANNEKIQNLGNEVYDFAMEWMKDFKTNKNK